MSRKDASSNEIRLRHILDAAEEALKFTKGKKFQDLETDRLLTLALMKEVEIIGEAAGQLSPEFRTLHKDIPWSRIIGMRHKLVHAYFDIHFEVLWKTVTQDLPDLRKQLAVLVKGKTHGR